MKRRLLKLEDLLIEAALILVELKSLADGASVMRPARRPRNLKDVPKLTLIQGGKNCHKLPEEL